jgi:hypothetical protein
MPPDPPATRNDTASARRAVSRVLKTIPPLGAEQTPRNREMGLSYFSSAPD